MGVQIENNMLHFEGVIYEDEVVKIRDFFQQSAPEPVSCDFALCDDIHTAVLQTLMAYQKLYACSYTFGSEPKMYQKVLEGFELSENHCN